MFVTGKDDWRELSIFPAASDRATAEQRALLARRMKPWTGSISSYLGALETLYEYLDIRENRSRDLYTHIFQEYVSEDVLNEAELSEKEQQIVDDLRERMRAAWSILEVGSRRSVLHQRDQLPRIR